MMSSFIQSNAGATGTRSASPSSSDIWTAQTVAVASTALPVQLTDFSVSVCNETSVCLTWQTGSEANNNKFLVQRSQDGKRFETIGTVKGAGNSLTRQFYSFTDSDPQEGFNYYRLKQVDFDGKYEYSPIEVVYVGDQRSNSVNIFPNATSKELNIVMNGEASNIFINILDYNGKVVLSVNEKYVDKTTLDISHLPQGNYLVFIKTGNQIFSERILKVE